MLDAEYVLPLRWSDDAGLDELAVYLGELVTQVPVTVVDGSDPELFARHAGAFPAAVRHVRPDDRPGRNGKVAGVVTGLRLARADRVVVADDDVRYDPGSLRSVVRLLDRADVVRPQNYFDPAPWHARWDTARTLVNRAFGSDYPGTLALRRTALGPDGYDGDVMFENLELIRTVRARGGAELRADDVLVARRPPAARHFLHQRPRQAYDSLAQPARLLAEAAVLPALVASAVRRDARGPLALAVAAVAAAERGRRRAGGRRVFPAAASLYAPLWVLERAVCVWLALALRLTGGVPYAGRRLVRAASRPSVLRARAACERAREDRRERAEHHARHVAPRPEHGGAPAPAPHAGRGQHAAAPAGSPAPGTAVAG